MPPPAVTAQGDSAAAAPYLVSETLSKGPSANVFSMRVMTR